MSVDVLEYRSDNEEVTEEMGVLGTIEKDGLICTWSGRIVLYHEAQITWKFNFDRLKTTKKLSRITGQIAVYTNIFGFGIQKKSIDMDSDNGMEWRTVIELTHGFIKKSFGFEFRLFLEPDYLEMFFGRDDGRNDTVILVDERELWVNKEFLSYHSDYFRAFFSTNWSQNTAEPLEIKDLSYKDFGNLISIIHPNRKYPNDITAEKLLKLADRFFLPTVTLQVEHHLQHHSRMEMARVLYLSDKHKLLTVLEKKIGELNAKMAEILKNSDYFEQYSKDLKIRINRIFEV